MAGYGGSVKLSGESEYRKALREITSNLKEVSSELKLTTTQFSTGDRTLKETKSSYNNMNTTLSQQREKVNSLREALQKAEKEYGSNNDKVKTFKTQLNKAEVQLVKMENETDKSSKELKKMKNSFGQAGEGALKFSDILKANILADVVVIGLKAVAKAIKEIASEIGKVAVESLNARGELEQQIGGIETLFKESSDVVIENANKAYQSAGLSAVDYMSTATSFSASLLQSLGGDTKKVAEVTDMAIIDMSDNANKMGTSMESIQNAYQGFAKQNYTMLDNLKLGYGGTKGEMERLLIDAQKITGVKYDISNLSDVYNAIHVIQGELDITGTTAKEASETFQGSMSSMKSAWSNFLSGSGTVKQLIDTVSTVVKNVSRIAQEAIPQVLGDIKQSLPQISQLGKDVIELITKGISDYLPEIIDVSIEIINTLIDGLIETLPGLIEAGVQAIAQIISGLSQALPTLIPKATEACYNIVEGLLDNIDLLIDAGIELIFGLADGLIEALPIIIEKAPEIIQKLVEALIRNFPRIVSAGSELIGKLVAGLSGSLFKLMEVAPKIVSSIVNGIKGLWGEMKNVGNYLIEGLWNGISGMANWVADKVKGFAKNIVGNIKDALGIHSPSAILRDEVGKFMAQGIGVGFSDEMKGVTEQMQGAVPTHFDIDSTASIKQPNESKVDRLVAILEDYLPQIITASNKQLVLDTGVLVGATANQYDIAFGNMQIKGKRGN